MFHLEMKGKISKLVQLFFWFNEHMNSKSWFIPLHTQMPVEVF